MKLFFWFWIRYEMIIFALFLRCPTISYLFEINVNLFVLFHFTSTDNPFSQNRKFSSVFIFPLPVFTRDCAKLFFLFYFFISLARNFTIWQIRVLPTWYIIFFFILVSWWQKKSFTLIYWNVTFLILDKKDIWIILKKNW